MGTGRSSSSLHRFPRARWPSNFFRPVGAAGARNASLLRAFPPTVNKTRAVTFEYRGRSVLLRRSVSVRIPTLIYRKTNAKTVRGVIRRTLRAATNIYSARTRSDRRSSSVCRTPLAVINTSCKTKGTTGILLSDSVRLLRAARPEDFQRKFRVYFSFFFFLLFPYIFSSLNNILAHVFFSCPNRSSRFRPTEGRYTRFEF